MSFKSSERFIIIVCFVSIYIVWGSTYLAIRFAIETLPIWALAATRFLVAGALMLGWSRLAKEQKLSNTEMKSAFITGSTFMSANALVCWVEKWIPSGIVAVAIGAMPIWMMLMGRIAFGQPTPSIRKCVGALVGLSGVSMIALHQSSGEFTGLGQYAILILLVSNWMWAAGTHLQKRGPKVSSALAYSAWQMLWGGMIVSVISVSSGELIDFPWSQVKTSSVWAWAYLVTFGSIVAFSAYSWLSRKVEPHVLSSYALVNPIIAVGLGWWLANETITPDFFIATLLVCAGLSLLLIPPLRRKLATLPAPSTLEMLECAKHETKFSGEPKSAC